VPYDPPAHGKREQFESAKDDTVIPLLRASLERISARDAGRDVGSSAVVFCGSKAAVIRTAARAAGVASMASSWTR
jgi:hypothetical protein